MNEIASARRGLAELHLHLFGCMRTATLLSHLAMSKHLFWDWYEAEVRNAYGETPAARALFER